MWQYFVYFLVGGTVVTMVAYIGSRFNGFLAALVASLPILFLLNVLLMYRNGGVTTSLDYVRGSLLFVPAFVCYGHANCLAIAPPGYAMGFAAWTSHIPPACDCDKESIALQGFK